MLKAIQDTAMIEDTSLIKEGESLSGELYHRELALNRGLMPNGLGSCRGEAGGQDPLYPNKEISEK